MSWKTLIDNVKLFVELDNQIVETSLVLISKLQMCCTLPKVSPTVSGNIMFEWHNKNYAYRYIEVLDNNRACLYYMPEEVLVEVDDCIGYSYGDFLSVITSVHQL